MPEPHDHEPDQAALDELMRAFGEKPDATAADVPAAEPAVDPDEADVSDVVDVVDAADGEPAELLIVEQEPMESPVDPTPTPPTVIRIDDYSGSVVTDVGAAEPPAPPEPAPAPSGDEPPAVIAIEDHDLPDPVYVAGNLERSGTRSIVFIEDDDTGDTIAPDAERDVRRGIEPRMRERRAAVKRAIGRKRLRWILLTFVLVVVGVGGLAVLGSGLFAVEADNVRVFGAVYADEADVQAVVDDLVGTPTLRADTQAADQPLQLVDRRQHTDGIVLVFDAPAVLEIVGPHRTRYVPT